VQRNLDVIVSAQGKGFTQFFTSAGATVSNFSRSVADADTTATRSFTNINRAARIASAGILAAGAAAGISAVGFDRSMTRIETLVGIARDEVDAFKDSVLALAGETARSPDELAEALFVVTSAGLRGQEALDALEESAKAAAIGMGETKDIARLAAAILNNYAAAGITASDATDILVATARAGNFEVSELANSMARVLPNASTLGVAMTDVGGAVALFTRSGSNAAQSVTALDSLLRAFLKPTTEAQEVLAGVGLSFEELQSILEQQGLVAALQTLDEALDGNRVQLAKVITDTQGLTGANIVLNASAQSLEDTFGVVANSSGILGTAFTSLGQSDAFKFDQALNDLTVSFKTFGLQILPLVIEGLEFLKVVLDPLVGAFTSIPGPVRSVVVALLLLQAAGLPIAPTLAVIGRSLLALRTASVASSAVSGMSAAMAGAAPAAGGLASVIGGALNPAVLATVAVAGLGFLAWNRHKNAQAEAARQARDLTGALEEQTGSVPQLNTELETLLETLGKLVGGGDEVESAVSSMGVEVAQFFEELNSDESDKFSRIGADISEVLPVLQTGTDLFGKLAEDANTIGQSSGDSARQFARLRAQISATDGAAGQLALSLIDGAQATGVAVEDIDSLFEALDKSADAYDSVTDAQRDLANDTVRTAQGTGALTDEQAAQFLGLIAGAENYAELKDALDDVVVVTEEAIKASEEEAAALAEEAAEAEAARLALRGIVEVGEPVIRTTEELAAAGAEHAETLRDQAEGLDTIAGSYDAAFRAMGPYADLLAATLDPAAQLLKVGNDAALAIAEAAESVARPTEDDPKGGDFNQGLREGGLDAAKSLDALIDYGEEFQGIVLATAAAGASADQLAAAQARLRAGFIDTARGMGATAEQAEDLAVLYFDIPPEILTEAKLAADDAIADLDRLVDLGEEYGTRDLEVLAKIDDIEALSHLAKLEVAKSGLTEEEFIITLGADPVQADLAIAATLLGLVGISEEETIALIAGDTDEFTTAVQDAIDLLNDVPARVESELGIKVKLSKEATGLAAAGDPYAAINDLLLAGLSHGGLYARNGINAAERYANGGERHVAQIAQPGAWRLWAEPETGGEAYIPLAAGSKRGRALAILESVANRFGYALTGRRGLAMAEGGVLGLGALGGQPSTLGGRESILSGGGGGVGIMIAPGAVVVDVAAGATADTGAIVDGVTSALDRLVSNIRHASTSTTGLSGGSRIRS
jgi:TP901 family phage tail tape measure protein